MVLSCGTRASTTIFFSSTLRSTMRSIMWKDSSCMIARLGARALGGNQFVDAGAQILQHEILFRGRLAVVDLLGPLFQRQLDAKLLVDRERDVQEIEAVDAEIVDGMAIRRDRVARDVAGFSDDRSDLIECGGHH